MAKLVISEGTGNGSSVQDLDPVILNWHEAPFNLTIVVEPGATTTGTVQYAVWDVFGQTYPNDTPVWFTHSTLSGVVGSAAVGNIAFPVTAVKLQIGAAGTDAVKMKVLQAGISEA